MERYVETCIQRWGNSLGLRIPKALAIQARITEGTPVELQLDGGRIIIRPKQYSLETLLAKVTPENLHQEIPAGRPAGREIW